MKYLIGTIIFFLSYCCVAEEVYIKDTGISFEAPDEFNALTQEIIDIKWPNNRAPRWAVGNKSGATTIAYDIKPNDISNAPLGELLDYFEKIFNQLIPGIVWKKREVIELSGKKWGYLEMTSNALDTDIYNIMLLTSHGKEMLIFNFNSTKEEFPKYEAKLRKSIASIKYPNKTEAK